MLLIYWQNRIINNYNILNKEDIQRMMDKLILFGSCPFKIKSMLFYNFCRRFKLN